MSNNRHRSRSRPQKKSSSGTVRPIIDMSSVKPFSHHPHGNNGGGSTSFTRTTVATSSSEESRAARSARSSRSFHEPRRDRNSSSSAVVANSAARSIGGSSMGRARSKSRPREAALISSSTSSSPRSSPRSPSQGHWNNRGRSHSRPRQKSVATAASARGRSMSIVRKEEVDDYQRSSSRGRSQPRKEIRGRSLGPPESSSRRSHSRSHRSTTDTADNTSVSRTSRSRSRVNMSSHRKSRCESMETMEEERDEDMSDRNLVYTKSSHPSGSSGRGRSLSRKRDSAVNVLEAANAAASQGYREQRGKSLPRNRGDTAAAAVAIAAALRAKQLEDGDGHGRKSKSQSFHDNGRRNDSSHRTAQPRSFHDTRRRTDVPHHNVRSSQVTEEASVASSKSSAHQRSKPKSQSFHDNDRGTDATQHPQAKSQSYHYSSKLSASSTFSDYDKRIAKVFGMAPCGTDGDSPDVQLDEDGCCTIHPFIQLKVKLPSGNWRTLSRSCVVCREEEKSSHATSSKVVEYRRSSDTGARPKVEKQDTKLRASVPVTMQLHESGDLSLTPSCLEEDTDVQSVKKPADLGDASSQGSKEHKTKNSVAYSSRVTPSDAKVSPTAQLPFEVSVPNRIENFDDESVMSKHSLDLSMQSAHTLEQDDTKSVKSSGASRRLQATAEDEVKSVRSNATTRRNKAAEDDAKSVRSNVSSRKSRATVDMSVVESVLQKIKSAEDLQKPESNATQPTKQSTPLVTRSNPPPPPPRPANSAQLKSQNGSNNASSNNSSLQRPPPPPPPPRPHAKNVTSMSSGVDTVAQKVTPSNDNTVDYCCSMNVLNPDPEPELQTDFGDDFDELMPPFEQMEVSGNGAPIVLPNLSPGVANANAPVEDWRAYCITTSGRENKEQKGGKRRIFGRNPKNVNNEREIIRSVRQMPFTDQFGDYGLYTGQVNEEGRPDGKGSMKYDNGVFYEGTWINGGHDKQAAQQYERIRSGFTSWQGRGSAQTKSGSVLPWNARKNDAVDPNKKIHVRGMEWTDLNGDSGRYTGECNASELPHGYGVMKYDFGLIAEGEWNNGVLKENPQDRLIAGMATPVAMSSGRSIGPGMSVGPGAQGFSAAATVMGSVMGGAASVMGGGMSVGPPAVHPMQYGVVNPMMAVPAAANFTMLAQQNAMLKSSIHGGGGSVYGGASAYGGGGSVYGGASAYGQMPPAQMTVASSSADGPPISEIKIN